MAIEEESEIKGMMIYSAAAHHNSIQQKTIFQ
jgi:hypothetical protein